MKKVILSAMLTSALFVPGVKAQTIHFGPKVGGNLSWISNDRGPVTGKKGIDLSKGGLHGGAYGEYVFDDTWGIRVEALYAGVGSKENKDLKLKLDYLTVPVLANFHLPSIEGLSFHLGPQVGLLTRAKGVASDQEERVVAKVDLKRRFKNIDFAIVGGAEYAFESGLIVGTRYNFGVTDVYDKEEYK
ncbi:MAG: PorT family protein, partial [Cytophagales bacterium]|nr:PorT family protein [Cytophagales bacterium]